MPKVNQKTKIKVIVNNRAELDCLKEYLNPNTFYGDFTQYPIFIISASDSRVFPVPLETFMRCSFDEIKMSDIMTTTDSIGHPHADLMMEYACVAKNDTKPWKKFEYWSGIPGWKTLTTQPNWNPGIKYRRKPELIELCGITFDRPIDYSDNISGKVFLVNLTNPNFPGVFSCDTVDPDTLCEGLAHKTEESAINHAKALLRYNNRLIQGKE